MGMDLEFRWISHVKLYQDYWCKGYGCVIWCCGVGSDSNIIFYEKALMQAIEHELEVTVRVHEVRSEYERQMEE